MNHKPISLDKLTTEQAEMLEILWSLPELADVEAWQSTLTSEELEMSQTLMRLVIMEAVDDIFADDVSEAREYLKKFQL
jgi:hypothetical protein